MAWEWIPRVTDSKISMAKHDLIKNIIEYLEDDTGNLGQVTLEEYNLLRLVKLMFNASNYLMTNSITDEKGTQLTSVSPIMVTIAPKVSTGK